MYRSNSVLAGKILLNIIMIPRIVKRAYVCHSLLNWKNTITKENIKSGKKGMSRAVNCNYEYNCLTFIFTGSPHYTSLSFSSWSTITHTSEKVLSGFKQLPWMQCVPRIGGRTFFTSKITFHSLIWYSSFSEYILLTKTELEYNLMTKKQQIRIRVD